MSRTTRANSAPPVLITTGQIGQAKFAPTVGRTTTTQLTPPQPLTISSRSVETIETLETIESIETTIDTTILAQHLSDTQDRLNHALSQLTAAQTTLFTLQSKPRPTPRPTAEKDALIKRLTQELSRKETKNQSLRHELLIAERKLDAAFANHDAYRKLGTRTLRKLLRDQAGLEGRITALRGENVQLKRVLGGLVRGG